MCHHSMRRGFVRSPALEADEVRMPRARRLYLVMAWSVATATSAYAQAGFQNLDFASASIPTGTQPNSLVAVGAALPGWTVYVGASQQATVLYNSVDFGTAIVSLFGPGSPFSGIPGSAYTPVLQAGEGFSGPVSAAIAQTGLIPAGANSLLFSASLPNLAGWQVTVGGRVIPVSQGPQISGAFYEYVGDISAFAGQTDELRFTALGGEGSFVTMYVDSISFSSSPAPEPGTCALLLSGAVMFGLSRWRQK